MTPFSGTEAELQSALATSPFLNYSLAKTLGELLLTVRGVNHHRNVRQHGGSIADEVFGLAFEEIDEELALTNKANRTFMIDQFGGILNSLGKQVIVYPDPTVKKGRETVGGVRIKAAPQLKVGPDLALSQDNFDSITSLLDACATFDALANIRETATSIVHTFTDDHKTRLRSAIAQTKAHLENESQTKPEPTPEPEPATANDFQLTTDN